MCSFFHSVRGTTSRTGSLETASELTTTAGRVLAVSEPRVGSRSTHQISPRVALEKRLAFARDLYRPWTAPVDWDAYPVEPHLVHLPPTGESVDGVAPFTRDLFAQV